VSLVHQGMDRRLVQGYDLWHETNDMNEWKGLLWLCIIMLIAMYVI